MANCKFCKGNMFMYLGEGHRGPYHKVPCPRCNGREFHKHQTKPRGKNDKGTTNEC